MLIRLKRIDRKEEESIMFNFPYEESEISNVYNQLELETATAPNCYIEEVVYDLDMNEVLKGKECNIDELNFLFKRMDSFDAKERKVFFASAFAENTETIAELINLSFNTHCYSLVSDFNNLETVGKDLYLSEKQAVAVKELDELNGESFAMEVIKNNPNSRITPYGVLYKNSNGLEQIYNGKQFPQYYWKENVATVQLTVKDANEFICLPCSDVEIEKALMRLETPCLHDCEVTIIDDNFSKEVLDIISADATPLTKIDTLNKLAGYYKEIGSHDIEYFEKLMDYVKPRTVEEVFALADSMYEFERISRELEEESWYVLDYFHGTDQEKELINEIKSTIENLESSYEEVYLLRNEEVYKIYDFDKGRGFQPDFILFLKKETFLYYQVFIEPKGGHLKEHDNWKDKFLKSITERYGENDILEFESKKYRLIGLPLFNNNDKSDFETEYKKLRID